MLPVEKLEKQFHRLCISEDDTHEAYEYLCAIDESITKAVRQGLIVASIVAYSRPFLKSKGGEFSTDQVSLKLERDLDNDEYALHQKVVDLRSGVVAHSDYRHRPVTRWKGVETGISASFTPMVQVLDGFECQDFKELAFKVMMLCKKKKRELDERLKEQGS
jgi:hypothetical protein